MSKEMIVRLNEDRVKIKGCEYVQDLIRCKDCKYLKDSHLCEIWLREVKTDVFCSFAEPKEVD